MEWWEPQITRERKKKRQKKCDNKFSIHTATQHTQSLSFFLLFWASCYVKSFVKIATMFLAQIQHTVLEIDHRLMISIFASHPFTLQNLPIRYDCLIDWLIKRKQCEIYLPAVCWCLYGNYVWKFGFFSFSCMLSLDVISFSWCLVEVFTHILKIRIGSNLKGHWFLFPFHLKLEKIRALKLKKKSNQSICVFKSI